MSENDPAIHEIEDRLQDLTEALREAGSRELASLLEGYARDFTVETRVRRSVNAIREHLEHWREHPSELPESGKVMLAANRLEDACNDALGAGVIAAAAPTVAARSRRLLAIALVTVALGSLALLVPIALFAFGIDLTDLHGERVLGPIVLPRGEETSLPVTAVTPALVPNAVTDVSFSPEGKCQRAYADGSSCDEVEQRLWPMGRLPTYELKLRNQAYGLLFSVKVEPIGSTPIAAGTAWLAATDDTPEGRYEVALEAGFLGYTPQTCELLQRVQGDCPPPRVGKGEQHAGVSVPKIIVEVVKGDPSRRMGEKRLAEAKAAELRRKGEERAQQIAAVLSEIRGVLRETDQKLQRRRWSEARDRLAKLALLFEPLDGLVVAHADPALVPEEVSEVRDRFEELDAKLRAFEQRVFDQTFKAVTAESNRAVPEESLFARVAKQFAITPGYVQEIYAARADEIARRLDARSKEHMDALKREQEAREKRCGPLPKAAWSAIDTYLKTRLAEPRVEVVLGECMTPRLTEHDCWQVRCDFKRKTEVAVEQPRVVTKHAADFYIVYDRITRHQGGS